MEALEDYLSHVHEHHERRRQIRFEVERLCNSIARVQEELDVAH
jgi:hypothetical protein